MYASLSVAATAGRARGSVPPDAPVHSMRSVSNHLRTEPGRRYDQLKSVSGSVEIAAWAIVGGADTTSGDIHVSEEAAVGPVRSISGNVVVGNKAWIRSAKTVSGHITLGRDVQVEEGVKSTSGTINTGHGCRIQGDVNSVSGDIALHATEVEGNIHVVSSDLTVAADSTVGGRRSPAPADERVVPPATHRHRGACARRRGAGVRITGRAVRAHYRAYRADPGRQPNGIRHAASTTAAASTDAAGGHVRPWHPVCSMGPPDDRRLHHDRQHWMQLQQPLRRWLGQRAPLRRRLLRVRGQDSAALG